MNRGRFTTMAVGVGIAGALGALGLERTRAEPEAARLPERPLPVPAEGFIRTAVAIGPGANVIDLSGPWEVFQDAAVAGGLSSGIDLALRVVERYLGHDAAAATAAYMEYERRSPAIA